MLWLGCPHFSFLLRSPSLASICWRKLPLKLSNPVSSTHVIIESAWLVVPGNSSPRSRGVEAVVIVAKESAAKTNVYD